MIPTGRDTSPTGPKIGAGSESHSHRAIFLDRDGTLMRDVDYCGDPNDVHVFPGAADALKKLKAAGYKLIVITNQSGIGRGLFSQAQYRAVESEVSRQLGPDLIDATYYCPHLPARNCQCRKPSPEMVRTAAREHGIDLERSFFIGDKRSDIACGKNAGVKTILVRTGYGAGVDAAMSDFVAGDLTEAANAILQEPSC
jgi:histidinol-phosphate phosphatase family protein